MLAVYCALNGINLPMAQRCSFIRRCSVLQIGLMTGCLGSIHQHSRRDGALHFHIYGAIYTALGDFIRLYVTVISR